MPNEPTSRLPPLDPLVELADPPRMRRLGWSLRGLLSFVALMVSASPGCRDGSSPSSGAGAGTGGNSGGTSGNGAAAGTSTSGGSGGGGGADTTIILPGGSTNTAGSGGAPSFESVVSPVVLCGDASAGAGDGAGGSDGSAGAGEGGEPGTGGAPALRDDTCAPPASQCADTSTLVYFTDGVCFEGQCQWTKRGMTCEGICSLDGCMNNITAK
jgi:hypothetical protein